MRTDAGIEILVRAFKDCTLPKNDWAHRQHLTLAVWYLRHHPRVEASDRIREDIKRFNLSHGNTTGDNETITLARIAVVSRFLGEHDHGQPLPLFVGALLE